MSIFYNPLWKLLLDKQIIREELPEKLNIAPGTLYKMNRGENISLRVINRICNYFDVEISEIIEHVPDAGFIDR